MGLYTTCGIKESPRFQRLLLAARSSLQNSAIWVCILKLDFNLTVYMNVYGTNKFYQKSAL